MFSFSLACVCVCGFVQYEYECEQKERLWQDECEELRVMYILLGCYVGRYERCVFVFKSKIEKWKATEEEKNGRIKIGNGKM